MKTWLPWCLLSVVLMLSGCRSTATPSPTVSSTLAASDAASATWKPVTFFDRPELQAGTGAMDAGVATEFSTTDSGLRYRILRNSDGTKPTAASTVSVNYRGWLNNGKVFDSSYERGEPTTFPLQNVIAGWTEGMQLVGRTSVACRHPSRRRELQSQGMHRPPLFRAPGGHRSHGSSGWLRANQHQRRP